MEVHRPSLESGFFKYILKLIGLVAAIRVTPGSYAFSYWMFVREFVKFINSQSKCSMIISL